jgi:endonuclease/exonuclease/phosphatase family metal-dependent hydrolase
VVDVRVLSYNIRALRDDEDAVVRVVRRSEADVVCLQEVPRFLGWRATRDRLARRCGLTVAASRQIAGLAVFCGPRARVLAGEYHLLTRVPRLHRRALALAALEIDGVRLVAASTHLDLEDAPRLAHTGQVLSLLDRFRRAHRAPALLAGDLNEEPEGPVWRLLGGVLQDCYAVAPRGSGDTYSAASPHKRIDGIFADPAFQVTGCGVPSDVDGDQALATDHCPVLADVTVH